jgi:hypothetical protein
MIFDKTNQTIQQHIFNELGIDVTKQTRERNLVEARCLYYVILFELTPRQSLSNIGRSVGRNHATVIHGMNQYDIFCFYNKQLDLTKHKILSLFKEFENINRLENIDDEIQRLERMIQMLREEKDRIEINKTLTQEVLVN